MGGVLQLFFMLWAGKRDGITLRIAVPKWTPEIKEFFKAFGAVTFGAASVLIAGSQLSQWLNITSKSWLATSLPIPQPIVRHFMP